MESLIKQSARESVTDAVTKLSTIIRDRLQSDPNFGFIASECEALNSPDLGSVVESLQGIYSSLRTLVTSISSGTSSPIDLGSTEEILKSWAQFYAGRFSDGWSSRSSWRFADEIPQLVGAFDQVADYLKERTLVKSDRSDFVVLPREVSPSAMDMSETLVLGLRAAKSTQGALTELHQGTVLRGLDIYRSVMPTTAVYVVVSSNGNTIPIEGWLERAGGAIADQLFIDRSVPQGVVDSEVVIKLPVIPGVKVIVPRNHIFEIVGVSFVSDDAPITSHPTQVRSCVLGGSIIDSDQIPDGATSVVIGLRRQSLPELSNECVQQIRDRLPVFDYLPTCSDQNLNLDGYSNERDLVSAAVNHYRSNYHYCRDDTLADLLNSHPRLRGLISSALEKGACGELNLGFISRINRFVPSFAADGALLSGDGTILFSPGHVQSLILIDRSPQTVDITCHVRSTGLMHYEYHRCLDILDLPYWQAVHALQMLPSELRTRREMSSTHLNSSTEDNYSHSFRDLFDGQDTRMSTPIAAIKSITAQVRSGCFDLYLDSYSDLSLALFHLIRRNGLCFFRSGYESAELKAAVSDLFTSVKPLFAQATRELLEGNRVNLIGALAISRNLFELTFAINQGEVCSAALKFLNMKVALDSGLYDNHMRDYACADIHQLLGSLSRSERISPDSVVSCKELLEQIESPSCRHRHPYTLVLEYLVADKDLLSAVKHRYQELEYSHNDYSMSQLYSRVSWAKWYCENLDPFVIFGIFNQVSHETLSIDNPSSLARFTRDFGGFHCLLTLSSNFVFLDSLRPLSELTSRGVFVGSGARAQLEGLLLGPANLLFLSKVFARCEALLGISFPSYNYPLSIIACLHNEDLMREVIGLWRLGMSCGVDLFDDHPFVNRFESDLKDLNLEFGHVRDYDHHIELSSAVIAKSGTVRCELLKGVSSYTDAFRNLFGIDFENSFPEHASRYQGLLYGSACRKIDPSMKDRVGVLVESELARSPYLCSRLSKISSAWAADPRVLSVFLTLRLPTDFTHSVKGALSEIHMLPQELSELYWLLDDLGYFSSRGLGLYDLVSGAVLANFGAPEQQNSVSRFFREMSEFYNFPIRYLMLSVVESWFSSVSARPPWFADSPQSKGRLKSLLDARSEVSFPHLVSSIQTLIEEQVGGIPDPFSARSKRADGSSSSSGFGLTRRAQFDLRNADGAVAAREINWRASARVGRTVIYGREREKSESNFVFIDLDRFVTTFELNGATPKLDEAFERFVKGCDLGSKVRLTLISRGWVVDRFDIPGRRAMKSSFNRLSRSVSKLSDFVTAPILPVAFAECAAAKGERRLRFIASESTISDAMTHTAIRARLKGFRVDSHII